MANKHYTFYKWSTNRIIWITSYYYLQYIYICLYVWTTYVNFIHLFRLIFVWYRIQINYSVYKQKQNYYLGIKSLNSYKNNKERLLSFDNRLNKCSYLDDVMRSNQLNTKFHTHIHIWLNIHSILQVFTNTICIIVIIYTF